ncbi:serine/threonine-protein kinase [Enhygromyxa salina]|uniref:Serine/threonine-protein kinase PK-1 n=1 Tax=Enhygromyxa salina TaxID=215803 RepID=A0A2S9YSL6_9BACT|nr:serine/threonine-protein kinase [Enhygromyxa salina]PRQ08083.1 Serine/threonine-protein kinase PK-1 [Enhygromyxa salina]
MVNVLQVFDPDRFQDVQRIGAGNNATVFSAWDRDLERRVALKISMQDTLLDILGNDRLADLGIAAGLQQFIDEVGGPDHRYTLLREARLLARVHHPNVVPALDVGVLDGSIALVMPLMTGGVLDGEARDGTWQQVLALALDIGEGLAALHEAGILHRDVKPNNVLFDGRGRPHLTDLGLACSLDDDAAMADWPGTRDYMAPETRARSHRDQRDDLYAYCIVVFQMFYGHLPFASKAARVEGRVSQIVRPGEMPPALREVLVGGLHPAADRRWPDMPTLLHEMRQASAPVSGRKWPLLAASVAAAFAVGVFASSSEVLADACDDISSEIAWDQSLAHELRRTLGSRSVSDSLDSWAARWVAMRGQECHAAKRAGQPQVPSACAARLQSRFNATIRVLLDAPPEATINYAKMINDLPPPERCLDDPTRDSATTPRELSDLGSLSSLSLLSTDSSPGMLELRDRDDELAALLAMDDFDECCEHPAQVKQAEYLALAWVHQSGYDIARALYWRGKIHRRKHDLDAAQRDLTSAFERATSVGADELGAEAMLELAVVAGERGQIANVDAYALVARGMFTHTRADRVAEVSRVHGFGLLSGSRADQARGVELLEQAVSMYEAQHARYGGPREDIATAKLALAQGLLALDRHEQALAVARSSLEIHQEAFIGRTPQTHALHRLIFVAQVELGQLREASFTTDELLQPLFDSDAVGAGIEECEWIAATYAELGDNTVAEAWRVKGRRAAVLLKPDMPDAL